MTNDSTTHLILQLSHELGVALEMSYDPAELHELWDEAVEGLRNATAYVSQRGLEPSDAAVNILRLYDAYNG